MQIKFKLISLNVGAYNLSQKQLRFFLKEQPDILCLQEITKDDFLCWKRELGMHGVYVSTYLNQKIDSGLAMLSRFPITKTRSLKYGSPKVLWKQGGKERSCRETSNRILQIVNIMFPLGAEVQIGNIHFTWSPLGMPSALQKKHAANLRILMMGLGSVILCGDLNTPRGGEIFSSILADYTDHIPLKYKTSIDGRIHRAGPLKLMVDTIFSSPNYESHEVRMVSGFSDHRAIVGIIRAKS